MQQAAMEGVFNIGSLAAAAGSSIAGMLTTSKWLEAAIAYTNNTCLPCYNHAQLGPVML